MLWRKNGHAKHLVETFEMKLFAFYVGGETETSNTELHDMRFAVGERVEDCYENLRRQWWGTPESLHIDCWTGLTHSDGYSISLRPEVSSGIEKLFFVNLGGYDPDQFTELHSNVFVVAPNKAEAKKRALATVNHWIKPHRDTLFEVEHIIGLSEVTVPYGLHIHLAPTTNTQPLAFVIGCYIRLGVK
jgi:hypothetical protein